MIQKHFFVVFIKAKVLLKRLTNIMIYEILSFERCKSVILLEISKNAEK